MRDAATSSAAAAGLGAARVVAAVAAARDARPESHERLAGSAGYVFFVFFFVRLTMMMLAREREKEKSKNDSRHVGRSRIDRRSSRLVRFCLSFS